MTDRYTHLVNTGFTATLAKRLGLPRPAILRRFRDGDPLLPGPVLVLGPDTHDDSDSDAVAHHLLSLGLDIHRSPTTGTTRWGAVILVLTEIARVEDLSEHVLAAGSVLKQMAPSGRLLTLAREPAADDAPALAAARQAIVGLTRSLAKELRAGATANGLVLAEDAAVDGEGVLAPLRWFLSARSAFVDGQLLTVGPTHVAAPADPAQADARPLDGRVAVVTGAARGIGAEIARTLARDGARVICVDVPAAGEQLAQVTNEVRGTALQVDITADDAGERIVEHARGRHGRLDIVVHNAGITRDKLLANMDAARWDSVLAVNTAAQLRINDVLLTSDLFRDAPRIVSLASTSGIAGNRGQTNYGASKAGVIGMVRATAPLLADVGGTVNAVAPGFIETEMTARIPFATREVARRLNSLQQGGKPIDVAEAVAFLASPGAGAISGQVLRVCGQNLVGGVMDTLPRSRTITGPPPGVRVETLPNLPGLGGLYVRGAAGSVTSRLPGRDPTTTLPAVAYRVEHVRVDAGHLTAYQHLLGETGADVLPSGFCHVLAFPVATAVMVRPDFPLPLLGMVHVANAASVLRPIHLGDTLTITAWTQDLRAHRRGTQLDVCAEITVDGEVAWRGVSTYLAKGVHLVGEAGGGSSGGSASGSADGSRSVGASVTWRLGADVGRAYGAVSGDRNPIHMSALSARAFGFPRAIAHGMYTAARALADVGARRGRTYDWTVAFAAPVLLPGRVDVTYTTDADGAWTYAGRSSSGKLHLTGTVTPTT